MDDAETVTKVLASNPRKSVLFDGKNRLSRVAQSYMDRLVARLWFRVAHSSD